MPGLFVFLWATGFIGAKFGLPYAEPFSFLAIRFAVVAVLMAGFSLVVSAPWPRDLNALGHIALAGLLVHGMYLGGIFAAIGLGLSAGVSSLVAGLQPVLTAMVAGPLLGEAVNRRQWLGIVLGFAGVVLVLGNRIHISPDTWIAVWPAVVGLIGITAGTLYQKRFCAHMDLRTGSAIQFAASCAALAVLALIFDEKPVQWTGEFLFAVGWLVIVLSFGAVTLLYVLIRRGAAAKVASLFYLVPPITALMAYFMFGETLGLQELIGMGVVVAGVALVTRN